MAYHVKEIYYTLQGEGAHTGRAAVFCRFAGCNLWSGREDDRAQAICSFCDTDFLGVDGPGGGRFESPSQLVEAVRRRWPSQWTHAPRAAAPFVVCTGGEPLLQLDAEAVAEFHASGFQVAVETNGTLPAPAGVDWLSVSPKAGGELVLKAGDELKLVVPQAGIDPEQFAGLQFRHYFLQPMDGPLLAENTEKAMRYCLAHPQWRLSLQVHKILGIA